MLLGISTFVWGKYLRRSNQVSHEVLYVLSPLKWSFIAANADVLNTIRALQYVKEHTKSSSWFKLFMNKENVFSTYACFFSK